MKAELGKMQLKWLILCHGDQQKKTFSCFQDYINMINRLEQGAQGVEKKYFASLKERISEMNLEHEVFKGRQFADSENLVKILFENVKTKAQKAVEEVSNAAKTTGGKKAAGILGAGGLLAAGSLYVYKNYNEKRQIQPETQPRLLAKSA